MLCVNGLEKVKDLIFQDGGLLDQFRYLVDTLVARTFPYLVDTLVGRTFPIEN